MPLRFTHGGPFPLFSFLSRPLIARRLQRFPLRVPRSLGCRCQFTGPASTITVNPLEPPRKKQYLSRTVTTLLIILSGSALGFYMSTKSTRQVLRALLNPPSDEETLTMWEHPDEQSKEIYEHIQNHNLARNLRANADFTESVPHMKIPDDYRQYSLTGGTLIGKGKMPVPPRSFTEKDGKSLVQIQYLGEDLCGHPGIIHGGLLATLLDEGLARCCFDALPNKIGVTASLNINYRKPAPANAYFVLKAKTTKVDGRKAWVEGHIENLRENGEEKIIYAEASGLFIEPRNIGMLRLAKSVAEKSQTQPGPAG